MSKQTLYFKKANFHSWKMFVSSQQCEKRKREKNISLFIQAAGNLDLAAVSLSLPPIRETGSPNKHVLPFQKSELGNLARTDC